MGIKNVLKSIIGAKRLSWIKGIVCHYVCSIRLAAAHKSKLSYDSSVLSVLAEFTDPRYHIFRGYYDLQYLRGDKFLCHRLPIHAGDDRETKCEIGYYVVGSQRFHKIAVSSAWCWQQGSRLRWHPQSPSQILFNDVTEHGYCTRIMDVDSGKQIKIIGWPLYDVSSDFKWGVSLNFSRLQRLRPGYGYSYHSDTSIDEQAPDDDGLFLVDLEKNTAKMIISLRELADRIESGHDSTHYLNHVSISPNNKHFIFFHVYVDAEKKGWGTVLYLYNIVSGETTILEKTDRVSHYCWIDDTNIMVTCRKSDMTEYYCIYNIINERKKILNIAGLHIDGHPNLFRNSGKYVTDTYPLENSVQSVSIFGLESDKVKPIAQAYHDYRMRGEMRCDLHPSVEEGDDNISVDTTYHGKRRSIVVFKRTSEAL